ncbi:endolytic transglycosylase MltG [Clostridium sp. Cult2]|uniref:endolytic transglycosylase MltG n=1 Tax=Clostridium sp. Cult2 TaxID=2079003 RepID=UPI001F1D544C|nr:endolytic transglycosylase MltG [Clostridium sp. Cult2]MCF6465903.1 hypothetical protein [Clostridium sp. Cult2]
MFNRYRLPFLLLGIGIGIIFTSILYTLNPNYIYKEYTEEEIAAKATDLGMVFLKENINTTPRKDSVLEEQEEIEFVVEKGDTLGMISKGLEEAGIIDDAEQFHKFAKDKGAEGKLRVGTYIFSSDLDYDTILSILTESIN